MRALAAGLAVVAWGCGGVALPPSPDGGPPEEPVPVRQCPTAFQWVSGNVLGVQGEQALVVLDGPEQSCAANPTALVTVRDPEGQLVTVTATQGLVRRFVGDREAEVHLARARFVPHRPGRYTVEARWTSGSVLARDLLAALPLATAGALTTRFVDRMDVCQRGPFRTPSGVTICQRDDGQVWAYGGGGAVLDHFAGVQLAVRGDEVWSWQQGQLEHRTALPAALRLDGAVAVAGSWIEGPTTPGRAVRGEPNRVFDVRWDGSQLQRTVLVENSGFDSPMLLLEGTQTWTGTGCLVEPGCTQAVCPPIYTCPYFIEVPFAADAQGLWKYTGNFSREGGVLSVTPRPFSKTLSPAQRPTEGLAFQPGEGELTFSTNRAQLVERARLGTLGPWLFVPRLDDGVIGWRALRAAGPLLTMTDDFTVAQGPDVFTLIATPTPVMP